MDQLPKRKYVCRDCDEFSTDDRASLDVHYNFEHELIELSYLEPEVILEELDGQVSLKPGKHRCNQACDFSTDTRERLDAHLCIEHMVFRTKCEQCDYSSEYPSVLRSHVQSVHEKIRHKCNLCELTYATKAGVNRHVKNVHGPTQTETSEADTSTDENDRDSVDTDDDENSTDEDSDTIGEALKTSSDKEDQMETSTPAPNACDIESTICIHDDPAWD